MIATTVERFGTIDILVNNAALFAVLPLIDADAAEAARFFAVNAIGPLNAARAFARWAIDHGRGGAIVNISSIAAGRPALNVGLYSASKAALDSLTRSMAVEWAGHGLRVNAVAPGHVATEGVLEDLRTGRLDEKTVLARIPAGRIADGDDIAEAVLFLCSERARHILGHVLIVDGGRGVLRSTIRPPDSCWPSSSLLAGAPGSSRLRASPTVAERAAPTNRICWYSAQSIATRTANGAWPVERGEDRHIAKTRNVICQMAKHRCHCSDSQSGRERSEESTTFAGVEMHPGGTDGSVSSAGPAHQESDGLWNFRSSSLRTGISRALHASSEHTGSSRTAPPRRTSVVKQNILNRAKGAKQRERNEIGRIGDIVEVRLTGSSPDRICFSKRQPSIRFPRRAGWKNLRSS